QHVVKQKMTLDIHNWSSSVHQEIHKIVKDEIFPIVNQVDARLQNFKIQFLKEATKCFRDFKYLAKEDDESLAKHKALELEIERLLRAVVSQDIMSIVLKSANVSKSANQKKHKVFETPEAEFMYLSASCLLMMNGNPSRVIIKQLCDRYKLELPEELSRVHNTFHVSNLKKCHADEPLAVPLDGLHFDDKLQFVEEPIEITDREVKRLKRSRIPLVKVRWNSKRGPEFTWEREDQFRKKYPHLFSRTGPSSRGHDEEGILRRIRDYPVTEETTGDDDDDERRGDLAPGLPHEAIPSPPLPIPSPPPNSPTYVEGSLGSRAAGIRQRDALPSPVHETEMPEICLPLRKRPCRTTPGPGYEVGESSAAGAARQSLESLAMVVRLDDARQCRLIRAESTCLYRDRPFIEHCPSGWRGGPEVISCVGTIDGMLAFRAADRRRRTDDLDLLNSDIGDRAVSGWLYR
ncbi:hypothetical protein Tco_0626737, partial [Tanacetum coccineum]